jgi:cytochrome c biogenesis protein CcmG/thiol:disulfide interchange protein DsbE
MSDPEPQQADDGPLEQRPRSRVVLWTSLAVAAVLAVLIALLASSKPATGGGSTSPLVGHPAPAVSGPALNSSRSVSLAQFSGRWVLVNFAASWCVPCRQETPQLQRFADEHAAAADAAVLGVVFDPSDVAALAAYLRSSGTTWPAVDDPSAEVAYGVSQIPQSYLVDPQGTVVAKFFGALSASQVDRVMAKASGSA